MTKIRKLVHRMALEAHTASLNILPEADRPPSSHDLCGDKSGTTHHGLVDPSEEHGGGRGCCVRDNEAAGHACAIRLAEFFHMDHTRFQM